SAVHLSDLFCVPEGEDRLVISQGRCCGRQPVRLEVLDRFTGLPFRHIDLEYPGMQRRRKVADPGNRLRAVDREAASDPGVSRGNGTRYATASFKPRIQDCYHITFLFRIETLDFIQD